MIFSLELPVECVWSVGEDIAGSKYGAEPRQGWSTSLLVSDLGYQVVGCNDLPELNKYIEETGIKSDVLVKKLI